MITVQIEGRSLVPSADMIAVEQDSGYETLHFEVPEIFPDGQTAYVMFQREDGSTETYMLGADGLWTLTSGLTKVPTKLAVFLRIVSTSGQVWNSYTFMFRVHNNFDITFGTVADDADTLNAALTVMSQYAVRAEDAQEAAETAQEAAQTAQSGSETALQGAQAAQTAAEAAQAGAVTAKSGAETAKAGAETALANAVQAKEAAQAAQAGAESAKTAAQAAQASAQESAQEAEQIAQGLESPDAQATTLPPGAQATAQWDSSVSPPVLKLGIPQGQSGEGSGDMLASVYDPDGDGKVEAADHADTANNATHADSAAALDENAAVSMDQVSGLESALAGKQPTGNYLTAETDPTVPAWAKAQAKPTYTADEVGARPDTWTPTADQVGASAKPVILTGTLTAEGWSGSAAPYTQTLTITGIPASQDAAVFVSIGVSAPAEAIEAWGGGMVMATAHGANSLTFSAKGEKPGTDLPIQVTVFK